jgi:hypothetical protein
MKKFVVILVLFSYAVAVTGLTVSNFYCCNKLRSTKIVFASTDKKNCTPKPDKKKCCRYDESFFKVNDNHVASSVEFVPNLPAVDIVYFDNYSFLEKKFSGLIIHYANAPPPKPLPPQYLLNCNFRI